MSYEPTEWKNGDIITAEKMNSLEGRSIAIYQIENNNGYYIHGKLSDLLKEYENGKTIMLCLSVPIMDIINNGSSVQAFTTIITSIQCNRNSIQLLGTNLTFGAPYHYNIVCVSYEFLINGGADSGYDETNDSTKIDNTIYFSNENSVTIDQSGAWSFYTNGAYLTGTDLYNRLKQEYNYGCLGQYKASFDKNAVEIKYEEDSMNIVTFTATFYRVDELGGNLNITKLILASNGNTSKYQYSISLQNFK